VADGTAVAVRCKQERMREDQGRSRPPRPRTGTDVEQRRRVIVALLRQHPDGLTAREMSEATGVSKSLTASAISGLFHGVSSTSAGTAMCSWPRIRPLTAHQGAEVAHVVQEKKPWRAGSTLTPTGKAGVLRHSPRPVPMDYDRGHDPHGLPLA